MWNRAGAAVAAFRNYLSLLHLVAALHLQAVLLQMVYHRRLVRIAFFMQDGYEVAVRRIIGGLSRRIVIVALLGFGHRPVEGRQHRLAKAVVILVLAADPSRSGKQAAVLQVSKVHAIALLITKGIGILEGRTSPLVDQPLAVERKPQFGCVLIAGVASFRYPLGHGFDIESINHATLVDGDGHNDGDGPAH